MDKKILEDLDARRQVAKAMGGEAAVAQHRAAGKLTARDRIERLLDPGSFQEIGLLARSQHPDLRARTPADGLVAGSGTINGRTVYVTSEDATILAGTRGRVAEAKTVRIRELALSHRMPFVALMEAGAGRFQENGGAIAAAMGTRFREHYELSGVVPQVAALMGACFGGPSFTAAQSDFVTIARHTGFMGMSGPAVVRVGIGLETTAEEIGGAQRVAAERGLCDHVGDTDEECLDAIRNVLSFFPSSCHERPPVCAPRPAPIDTPEGREEIAAIVSENHRRAYDMRAVVRLLVDGGEYTPYKELYGQNLIAAWARMEGQSVGILASNPLFMAGALDEKAAIKARRFIDICDAFHIPLVFLTDCPGFLVGPAVEQQRMVALASQLLNAVIGASVPQVTVVLRKAIGLAYIALGGRATHPDGIAAWPTARFDVMGTAAGVELVHGKEIARAAEPAKRRAEIIETVEAKSSAYMAAEMALIDDVIQPAETRAFILSTLARARARIVPGFKRRITP
ncbi:carboxyl transferase domain-containing protein [Xanthobacter sp. DSM 24535]|uniref:acyl-CoA carboxylase subunit beta n=1 Tax=Roseixanthobacter psychrophilus TaxID=3119917 RepID=UPI00372CDBFA